jgi:ferrous iron transport protein A
LSENEFIGLDGLRPGEAGRVHFVAAEAPLATRLADLGFCPGTDVRVVRRAPLGEPVLYELRGYQIALRHREASLVRVERTGASRARADDGRETRLGRAP